MVSSKALRFEDGCGLPAARLPPDTAVTRRDSLVVRTLAFATAMDTRTLLGLFTNSVAAAGGELPAPFLLLLRGSPHIRPIQLSERETATMRKSIARLLRTQRRRC